MTSRPNIKELSKSQRGLTLSQSGFTLVEIAIVLVIIGLLLGGVLKGQELITSAKVRALNDKVSGTTAAWFAFQDRFRAKPGDYGNATSTIAAAGLENGDNDGTIDTDAERGDVWTHLALAGMISGNFDSGTVGNDAYNCATTSCLDNGFGAGMNISFNALGGTGNSNELLTGYLISSTILAELDRKIDDGLPTTGDMRLGLVGTGWLTADRDACLNATPTPSEYQTLTPSENCAAVVRNF